MSKFNELLHIQNQQIREWRCKLSPECYNSLVEWVLLKNSNMDFTKDPFNEVKRGVDLTTFIQNWKPSK
jgi:hypothetical protein